MSSKIKITAKRQATLPVKLCEEMNVSPGDTLIVERHEFKGSVAWMLMTPKKLPKPWFGSLNNYAKGKSHEMEDIRKSIGLKNGMGK